MKATSKIAWLIKRYMEEEITPDERALLEQWRQESPENEAFFGRIIEGEKIFEDALSWIELENDKDQDWLNKLKKQTFSSLQPKVTRKNLHKRPYIIYYAAAAAMLLVGVFGYFQLRHPSIPEKEISLSSIQAGTNKAELVLSNGKRISLREDKDGIVLDDQLVYSDGTQLLAVDKDKLTDMTATIHVPKGGKYKVTLSDGSKVWLNAESKLIYPLVFDKKHRKVTLTGEAYFEVATITDNNQRIPFEVLCDNQRIHVTGTAFNVSAYADDAHTVTTLVEGSVSIESGNHIVHLEPNQQAISGAGKISKKKVDVQAFIAWKNNKFLLYETELRDLMKSLSRWYAIDVSYPDEIPPTYFYGEIDRDKNLAEVLRIIEKSGVKFMLQKKGTIPTLIVIQ